MARRSSRSTLLLLSLLAAGVTACTGDPPTRPDPRYPVAPRAATGSTAGTVLSQTTVLAVNDRPLRAARFRADSADRSILIAETQVRGQAGDSIAVVLKMDNGTRDTMGADAALRVEVDGARYELPLRDLTAGARLYRFADDRSVTVRYHLLGPVASDVAPGRFLLEQRTSGAVENVQTPWIPKGQLVPGSAASVAAADPQCFIIAGTGDCGGISYTVVSFIESLDIGGTFTSRSNTGPSGTITITFSAPVPSVTVTIYDPTYAGNTVSTVGGGSASFAYSGQPGVNIPDTKTVTGQITQVSLVPAENDYVAYSVSFLPPPQLTVTCTPAAPVRTKPVTCTAAMTDGSQFTLTGVKATSDDGRYSQQLAVSQTGTSIGWAGLAIVPTRVEMSATVNGTAMTATGSFTVQSRIGNLAGWMDPALPDTGFTATPPTERDTTTKPPFSIPYPGFNTNSDTVVNVEGAVGVTIFLYPDEPAIVRPSQGPNAGIGFFQIPLWAADRRYGGTPKGIWLERSMRQTDAFYKKQKGPFPYCTKQQFDMTRTVVLTHEQRHWNLTRPKFQGVGIQRVLDSVFVYPGQPTDAADAVFNALAQAYADSASAGAAATHAVQDVYPNCQLRSL